MSWPTSFPFRFGNEAIFIFMTRELAMKYLDVSDAEPQEKFLIVEINVEEVL